MKKVSLAFLALLTAVSLTVPAGKGNAASMDDINRKLEQIQQQEQQATKKRQEADKLKSSISQQKGQEIVSMNQLLKEIDQQGAKLNDLTKKVNNVTLKLKDTSEQLDAAEKRVADRDKQLKSRVQAMYMNGTVSYLDVLLSATSFSDFIDRFNMIKTIAGNDKELLEANKKDRDVVVVKKKEVETQLAEAQKLYAEAEDLKQQLLVKEKQKEVAIASLSSQESHAEGVSEEQEKSLVALAKQKADLYAQKNEILKKQQEEEKKKQQQQGLTKPVNISDTGRFAWPVPSSSNISSTFGYRIDPIAHENKLHKGIDIAAPNGSTIVAADDGIVLISSWVRGYGNTVVIDHGNGVWTWYGHIRDGGLKVSEGQSVKRGQKIAEVGSTGDSTGNHCHFEVRINENPVNPMPYLK